MGHVHGLHKGSKALLPLVGRKRNSENNFERRSTFASSLYRELANMAEFF
jgi:hypothetical protein